MSSYDFHRAGTPTTWHAPRSHSGLPLTPQSCLVQWTKEASTKDWLDFSSLHLSLAIQYLSPLTLMLRQRLKSGFPKLTLCSKALCSPTGACLHPTSHGWLLSNPTRNILRVQNVLTLTCLLLSFPSNST